jgi:peptidoglycan hydrolase-like protein with peptidoglycan-binding domain
MNAKTAISILVTALSLVLAGCQTRQESAYNENMPQEDIMVIPPEETMPADLVQPQVKAAAEAQASSSQTGNVSESEEVRIQKALAAAGFYKGVIDGKIGPISRQAIKNFQKANGLKVDGKVGPQTWGALEKYLK